MIKRAVSLEDITFQDLLNERDGNELLSRIIRERKPKLQVRGHNDKTFLHVLVASPFTPQRNESLKMVLESNLIDINSTKCQNSSTCSCKCFISISRCSVTTTRH